VKTKLNAKIQCLRCRKEIIRRSPSHKYCFGCNGPFHAEIAKLKAASIEEQEKARNVDGLKS
jgi:hypothetical protein